MDIFKEVLATIQEVIAQLKAFFENILGILKGEDEDADAAA